MTWQPARFLISYMPIGLIFKFLGFVPDLKCCRHDKCYRHGDDCNR